MSNPSIKEKGPKAGLNIGASSVLVVFVILALVTFSVMSLVSAKADYKLSQNIAERTRAYYDATSEASKTLETYASEQRVQTEMADFTVSVNDTQHIHVIATLPPTGSSEGINILSWKVE